MVEAGVCMGCVDCVGWHQYPTVSVYQSIDRRGGFTRVLTGGLIVVTAPLVINTHKPRLTDNNHQTSV